MANRFELLLPDIAGSFRQGRADVRQEDRERLADQELRAQVDRGNQFRQLAGQAATAQNPMDRQQLTSQAYGADPRGAMQLEDQFASNEERKEALKGNTAKLLMSLPQEARAAQYHKMRPTFLQAGMEAPPEYTPEMDQMMQAYATRGTGQGNPASLQHFDAMSRGMKPEDIDRARRIELGLEGRAASGGFGFRTVQLPDGRETLVVTDPRTGGVRQATAQEVQAFMGNGPPPGQPPPAAAPPPSTPAPAFTGPTPGQIETDKARGKAQVELETAPEIARRTAEATEQGKTRAELQETQRKNKTAFNVYSTGMTNLRQAMAGTDTGPLAGRIPAVTSAQQIAEGAGAAMAPVLKQLFREAGEGTFTEGDQKLLTDMLPKRTDHPEAAKAKLQMIDELVAAKLGQRLGAPPPGGGAEVTATGPNGQKAVLRNGQWILQ